MEAAAAQPQSEQVPGGEGRKAIWKFEVTPAKRAMVVEVPMGAEFLSIIEQGGLVQSYFIVDLDRAGREQRVFYVAGTGSEPPGGENVRFVGSINDQRGFVWHYWLETTEAENV